MADSKDKKDRIEHALRIAAEFGQTDGAHHKAWVIDQMVYALTGSSKKYTKWVKNFESSEGGPYEWDKGTPP